MIKKIGMISKKTNLLEYEYFTPASFNRYKLKASQNTVPVKLNSAKVIISSLKYSDPMSNATTLDRNSKILNINPCFCFSKTEQRFDKGEEIKTNKIQGLRI